MTVSIGTLAREGSGLMTGHSKPLKGSGNFNDVLLLLEYIILAHTHTLDSGCLKCSKHPERHHS